MSEYDAFSEIYDVWARTAPITEANLPFYVDTYVGTDGPVAELGVGNGRIALEAARRGKSIIGVDLSSGMLDLCRARAKELGVADRVTLLQGDMRSFELPEPAALITVPYHSIGHLITSDDRQKFLECAFGQLRSGGRVIFDHFIFRPEIAKQYVHPQLRTEYADPETGRDTLLWVTSRIDEPNRTLHVVTWTDILDESGVLLQRKYRRLTLAWFEPEEARTLLSKAGFEIESVYGDYARAPFDPEKSPEQIWVARKPA